MDTSYAINRSWKLCTFAGFIGCIVLFFCSNNDQENKNLLPFGDIAMPITSSDPTSAIKTLEPTSVVIENYENTTNKEEVKCNIFDGNWVYNPKRSPLYNAAQCPFLSDQVSCQRNGRPDSEYEGWSWEVKGCDIIPSFNGTNMLERLKGKRVIFVGDSLNRNQWESLACILYSSINSSRALVDVRSSVYKVFKAKDYNCFVEFYWSPFLVQLEAKHPNGSRILKLDKLSASAHKWRGADIMVFNTGHWWAHRGKIKAWDCFQYEGKLVEEMNIESALKIGIRTWARWIDRNTNKTKTTVFFRSISPEHKEKQWCYNRTQPIMDESYLQTFPKPIIEIIEGTIGGMKTPVRYLNITKLSHYRIDAHPAIYARKQGKLLGSEGQQLKPESRADCSHWCLPGLPDTWNKLLYASIVSDRANDSSSSIVSDRANDSSTSIVSHLVV